MFDDAGFSLGGGRDKAEEDEGKKGWMWEGADPLPPCTSFLEDDLRGDGGAGGSRCILPSLSKLHGASGEMMMMQVGVVEGGAGPRQAHHLEKGGGLGEAGASSPLSALQVGFGARMQQRKGTASGGEGSEAGVGGAVAARRLAGLAAGKGTETGTGTGTRASMTKLMGTNRGGGGTTENNNNTANAGTQALGESMHASNEQAARGGGQGGGGRGTPPLPFGQKCQQDAAKGSGEGSGSREEPGRNASGGSGNEPRPAPPRAAISFPVLQLSTQDGGRVSSADA